MNGVSGINMILDSGSPYTLLLDFTRWEELLIKKGKQISIGGLGHGHKITAYDSRFNELEVGKAHKNDAHLILLLDSELNLSRFLGMPVHGIIGTDLLKDFVVEINYRANVLTFYNHDHFYARKKRKLKAYKSFPLTFHDKKPYVKTDIRSGKHHAEAANMLIDTGGWDAVWWFSNTVPSIPVPAKNYKDTLGHGIQGPITGFRSKTDHFKLNDFQFHKPTTSFPDSLSLAHVVTFEGRNGSIGGELLRRFHVILDYRNKKMYLKPNKDYSDEFHYDMSGLKLHKPYDLLPFLEVASVRYDSPAYHAGISIGDLLTAVNGEDIQEGELGRINVLFRSKPDKKITVSLLRNGNKLVKTFYLKDDL